MMTPAYRFPALFPILARDYKFVGDGRCDWALAVVGILLFIGAEVANRFDERNR